MSNRHLSRSLVLQTLFEVDSMGAFSHETFSQELLHDILLRNQAEFAPGLSDMTFSETLSGRIIEKRATIDDIIKKAAPEWPLEKISTVDRNILRIGLCELLFSEKGEVPPKVAIDEAIELAKSFGGETSSRFVNGVLGAIYKEMGEPEKDQQSKHKKQKHQDIASMPRQVLGGAVVYSKDEAGVFRIALVHDIFGHWTLSKGKLEEGEDAETGTVREIKEEMGVDLTIEGVLGENEYTASNPELGKIRKHVYYFLGKAPYTQLVKGASGGLDNVAWFTLEEIPHLNIYDDILPLIEKAIIEITKVTV